VLFAGGGEFHGIPFVQSYSLQRVDILEESAGANHRLL
jgi:hypothetical protein